MILFLLFFICVQGARSNEILSMIQQTVLGHMYLYSVDDMCTVVLRRMSYKGIFVADHSICPEAPIESDYADTLRELYEYYPLMADSYVQIPMKAFAEAQHQVLIHCTRTFDVLKYIDQVYPMFEYDPCFEDPGSVNDGFEDEACMPIEDVYIGNATEVVISSASLQKCLDNLDKMKEKRAKFTDSQLFKANMPGIIAPEISRVWTELMPGWLQKHSSRPLH